MTTQQTTAANVALVRSSLDAFNEGDIHTCVALLSPDFVMNIAGRPQRHSPDVWRQGVQIIKLASLTCTRTSTTSLPRATRWPSG